MIWYDCLGLEPSDSDTDSEEDETSVGSRELQRCFTGQLIDTTHTTDMLNETPLERTRYAFCIVP